MRLSEVNKMIQDKTAEIKGTAISRFLPVTIKIFKS